MEEIRSKDFEDPNQTPVFGPESGESGPADYDDVDDYDGFLDNPSVNFSRSVSISFAELAAGTWQVAGSPPTNYKGITITVEEANNSVGPVKLEVLTSNY